MLLSEWLRRQARNPVFPTHKLLGRLVDADQPARPAAAPDPQRPRWLRARHKPGHPRRGGRAHGVYACLEEAEYGRLRDRRDE